MSDERSPRLRQLGRAAPLAVVVLLADLGTKAAAAASLELGEREPVFPAVTLVHARNSGAAFGLFRSDDGLPLAAAAVALTLLVVAFTYLRPKPLSWLGCGLLCGGAIANVADRLSDGFVTDWIDLPLWPSFNLADVAIVLGCLAMVAAHERPKRPAPQTS